MKLLLFVAVFVAVLAQVAICQTNSTKSASTTKSPISAKSTNSTKSAISANSTKSPIGTSSTKGSNSTKSASSTQSASGEKCFKFDAKQWAKQFKSKLEKRFEPLIGACKAEKANASSSDIRKCCKTKLHNAWKDCKESKDMSRRECVRQKLRIEKSDAKNMTKEEVKKNLMNSLVNEKKKDAINTAIEPCKEKEGRNYWLCCLEKVSEGPCPEVKSLLERVVAFKERLRNGRGKGEGRKDGKKGDRKGKEEDKGKEGKDKTKDGKKEKENEGEEFEN